MSLDAFLSSAAARRMLRGTLPTRSAEKATPAKPSKASPAAIAPAADKQPAKSRK